MQRLTPARVTNSKIKLLWKHPKLFKHAGGVILSFVLCNKTQKEVVITLNTIYWLIIYGEGYNVWYFNQSGRPLKHRELLVLGRSLICPKAPTHTELYSSSHPNSTTVLTFSWRTVSYLAPREYNTSYTPRCTLRYNHPNWFSPHDPNKTPSYPHRSTPSKPPLISHCGSTKVVLCSTAVLLNRFVCVSASVQGCKKYR